MPKKIKLMSHLVAGYPTDELAITAARAGAIATGNCVLYKPSSLSSLIGFDLVAIFKEAGLPDGVFNYCPGRGSVMGDYLVTHPKVTTIAFTGSMEVGLRIQEKAAVVQPHADVAGRGVHVAAREQAGADAADVFAGLGFGHPPAASDTQSTDERCWFGPVPNERGKSARRRSPRRPRFRIGFPGPG